MERDEDVFSFLLFFFFFCFSSCCFCSFADTSPQLDRAQVPILVSLSSYLPSSFAGAQWNGTTRPNPCTWKGVSCSATSLVAGLDLAGVGFSAGAGFFENLCRLDSLSWLDLSKNAFTSIPESFFPNCSGFSGLRHLNMSSNGLTGRLQNFSSFGSLQTLDLSRNKLTGGIGLQLDDLAELQSLNLSFNSFDDENVPSLRKAHGLRELVLSYNLLAGEIPTEISLHTNCKIPKD